MEDSRLQPSAARRALAKSLLAWFSAHARDLPWRRTRDLYAVWISEIMLQQTQVATVVGYFERFLAAFPTVRELADAEEAKVLRLWEGLGYYRRARQLHAAAKLIVREHSGEFPRSYEAVRALPGIGRYTAGAILSIGLDQRLPILEANTIRVLSRLIALRDDPRSPKSQARLWQVAEEILPASDCGAFNQALMELGSELCTPKSPRCSACPVVQHCAAFTQNLTDQIPLPAKKTEYTDLIETAIVIRRSIRVLVRQCQPGERWAGLWDFPRFASLDAASPEWAITAQQKLRDWLGLEVEPAGRLATTKHGVTRYRITLHVLDAQFLSADLKRSRIAAAPQRWVTRRELSELPLSVTGRKIASLLATQAAVRRSGKGGSKPRKFSGT